MGCRPHQRPGSVRSGAVKRPRRARAAVTRLRKSPIAKSGNTGSVRGEAEMIQGAAGPDQDQVGPRLPRLRRMPQLHPPVEQHQGAAGRCGAAAALYGLRAAELLGRAVQRDLAGPGARRDSHNPAHERAGQPAAGPLFPAGATRCAADRRVLSGPFAEQPRMHGQARRIAGASRVQMHKHLRCG